MPLPSMFALMAAVTSNWWLALIGSVLVGAAVFALAWMVVAVLATEDLEQDEEWRYDVNRINELRKASALYRLFQPVVRGLAAINRRLFRESLPEIGRQIQAAGLPRFWTPEEYLGRIELLALLLLPVYGYLCYVLMGMLGLPLAPVFSGLTGYLLRRRLATRAQRRLTAIKRRMPFVLDLLTLLMESGSTFLQALNQAVEEFRDHPVGDEFGRVLAELSMGKTRTEALQSMEHRLADDEITSIIGSIVQGETLGTPLARLFRTQADVLRIKRTQRAETLAGEAGVRMLLPAVLVMAATVLIILGPFVISFIYAPIMP